MENENTKATGAEQNSSEDPHSAARAYVKRMLRYDDHNNIINDISDAYASMDRRIAEIEAADGVDMVKFMRDVLGVLRDFSLMHARWYTFTAKAADSALKSGNSLGNVAESIFNMFERAESDGLLDEDDWDEDWDDEEEVDSCDRSKFVSDGVDIFVDCDACDDADCELRLKPLRPLDTDELGLDTDELGLDTDEIEE